MPVTLFAANDPFGGLIGLVIFVAIAAISHFLKRKQGGQGDTIPDTDEDEVAPPVRRGGRPSPQPAGRQLSWEEELKRLLEGQTPAEPPAAPPPVVIVQREAPAPQPVWSEPEPAPAPVFTRRELPPVFTRPGPTEEAESHERHDTATGHMAVLREAASAHDRASHLGESFRERFESADRLAPTAPATRSAVRLAKRSSEVESVVALLRHPKTARQVFIASAVFGQPKALAET
jgi:hypothetical protein